jgi:POLQ-like helicase
MDKQIFQVNKEKLKNFVEDDPSFIEPVRQLELTNYTNEMKKIDPDGLIALVKEVFDVSPDGLKESCLIFCSSKKNCENVAKLLSENLPSEFKSYKRDLKLKLFNELKEANSNNICPTLRLSLQYGIAYHHSGLTTDERNLIETGFREGVLFLLTCTSTLAAGVNLPAKRVIIRSPYVGMVNSF